MFVATVVPCRRLSTSASATPAFAQSAADAFDHAAGRVVRRRRNLVDRDPAGFLVDEDQVGERAADVDPDPLHAGAPASAGTISRPTRSHLLEPAVQVGGRDLRDAERGQLADPLEAAFGRAEDRVVVDQLVREPGVVLGRGVEVAGVVVVVLRPRVDEAGQLLGQAVVGDALHHVREMVGRAGRAQRDSLPGLGEVVGDPQAAEAAISTRPDRVPPPRPRRGSARPPTSRRRGSRRSGAWRCLRAPRPAAGFSGRSRRRRSARARRLPSGGGSLRRRLRPPVLRSARARGERSRQSAGSPPA